MEKVSSLLCKENLDLRQSLQRVSDDARWKLKERDM